DEALKLSRERGDLMRQGLVLQSIGTLYHSIGEYEKAVAYLNQSLPLLIGVNSRTAEARAQYYLGSAYIEMGGHTQAFHHLTQALQIWKTIGDQAGIADTVYRLARLERNRGNLREALSQIDTALDII